MPAPAVIPAPIAYINAAAVKGFVVGFRVRGRNRVSGPPTVAPPTALFRWDRCPAEPDFGLGKHAAYTLCARAARRYYCEQNSVFKAGYWSLNDKAWNNNGSHDCASFCWFLKPICTTCRSLPFSCTGPFPSGRDNGCAAWGELQWDQRRLSGEDVWLRQR